MRTLLTITVIAVVTCTEVRFVGADSAVPATGGAATQAPVTPAVVMYRGRTFEEWLTEFETELAPAKRIEPLKALVVFGANGKANEVVSTILKLLDGYRPEVITFVLNPSEPEIRKILESQAMNGELEHYFTDIDDLKLFRAAAAGFVRLSHRARTQLMGLLDSPDAGTTSKILVLSTYVQAADSDLATAIPKLVARHDQVSPYAWSYWEIDDEIKWQPGDYEKCTQALLESSDVRVILRAVKHLAASGSKERQLSCVPLLQKLAKSSTDAEVLTAVGETLKAIEKLQPMARNAKPADTLPTY